MSVASFTFCSGSKYSGNVVVTFDISLYCKVQIPPVCLGLPGKCILKILFGYLLSSLLFITNWS